MGVRYELLPPFKERDGLLVTAPSAASLLNPQATYGYANQDLYSMNTKNFAPNVGLAWDVLGKGKTVLRAGYSINFVNDDFIQAAQSLLAHNNGLSQTVYDFASDPNGNQTPVGYLGGSVTAPSAPAVAFSLPSQVTANL